MFKFIGGAIVGATVTLFIMALLLAARDGKNNEEVKRGKWLKFSLGDFDFVDRYKCSLCGNIVYPATNHITNFLYCSKCGAKMDLNGGAE